MAYKDTVIEHLRLCTLRLLEEDGNYTLNESLARDMTRDWGFTPTRDHFRTQLAWLQEQGLVTLGGEDTCYIVTLTERGLDVAQGNAIVPGVKRRGPGA
ncbi:MAG: ArsR family transcriptional regulator [Desulfovibrionaceae bacterium]